jgi:N-acetylglucosaminyldiphosphoundecaprenol N-acetyl-beta-D-mannosaminyltransferase
MLERTPLTLRKFQILGQPVHLAPDYVRWTIDRMERGVGTRVVTMNAEIVMEANKQPQLAQILQKADLVTPDGAGLVMALKLHGIQQARCAGIEFGEVLLEVAATENYRVFFYGGKPGVADRAAEKMQAKFPNLNIVGIYDGYIDSQAQIAMTEQLSIDRPKIILVALGVPRQELWIDRHFHLCPDAIWVGVGGSFDVWSGVKNRAPMLFRKLNLEWLYRFGQEPSRWRRMLALPQFALLALGERIRQGKLAVR